MKEITKEWLIAAEDDLKAAKTLFSDASLTNLVAFHAQQCVEKCFKALAEENGIAIPKTHDLIRLYQLTEAEGSAFFYQHSVPNGTLFHSLQPEPVVTGSIEYPKDKNPALPGILNPDPPAGIW